MIGISALHNKYNMRPKPFTWESPVLIPFSAFETQDVVVSALLDSGYNRCIIESQNILVWVNELTQLRYSDIRPLAQYSTTQVLFAALDNCKESVVITDDTCRVQYINSSGANFSGFRPEELMGKTLYGQLAHDKSDLDLMNSRLIRGRIWRGNLTLKRKSDEPVKVKCTAVPINCAGKTATHFAIVLHTIDSSEAPNKFSEHDGVVSAPKHSSMERKSTVEFTHGLPEYGSNASLITKRSSERKSMESLLLKVTMLPLDTPVAKIINLINQAQDSAGENGEVVNLLDKVINILRSTELYEPPKLEQDVLDGEEAIATDLITALITKAPLTPGSRRSSINEPPVRGKIKNILQAPPQIKQLLEKSLSWDFDMMRLEQVSNKAPLLYLGCNLLTIYNCCAALNCDERTMYNYILLVESKYRPSNFYHNSTHAADVMQAIGGYMKAERLDTLLGPLDKACCLIAAACHDLDHPGKSSSFLSNSDNPLAILYNDVTVLEMHHAALAFQLALGDDRVNIYKNLDRETYKHVRQDVIDMILATEMTKHFEHLAKFVSSCTPARDVEDPMQDYITMIEQENMQLVKRMMIKCADVSNPTRPLHLCIEWTRRITEEYCQQTDEEKMKGLPILMPMFDRATCAVPKAQIGFYDFIINDMVEAWNAFIDFPDMVSYMRMNYLKWKELDEQGFSTLDDLKKLQI